MKAFALSMMSASLLASACSHWEPGRTYRLRRRIPTRFVTDF